MTFTEALYRDCLYKCVRGGGNQDFTNFWRGGGLESVAQKLNDPGQSQRAKPFFWGGGGQTAPFSPPRINLLHVYIDRTNL